jgi:Spy/CpxP family protein refolding chaperone
LKFPTKPKNPNPKARLTLQNFTSRDKKHSTKPIFRASNIVKSESLIPKIKKRYKMSFKNKFFSALTMAFALLAFSTFASAQETPKTDSDNTQKREWRKGKRDGSGKGFRRGGMRGGKYLRGFRDLNLTDAQKAQVRTIMEANRPDQAAFEEMKTLRQAKRDGSLTAEQKDRLKTLRQQSREKGQAVRQQLLAVLTDEQRQQLEAKKAEMKQKREERKQQRRENRQNQLPESKDN